MSTPLAPRRGVNLGGWLSQFPDDADASYFDAFVTRADIDRIAGWGLDHVRLPLDYALVREEGGAWREDGFRRVETCLDWCGEAGLAVVLDLHRAPGYGFDEGERNVLFAEDEAQDRFVDLWDRLSARLSSWPTDRLAYELLNEVFVPDPEDWNGLAARAVATIRSREPGRTVVIGGNLFAAPEGMETLVLPGDPCVLPSVHFYRPFSFTHQRAHWLGFMQHYRERIGYPGVARGLGSALEAHGESDPLMAMALSAEAGQRFDAAYLEDAFAPALAFARDTGRALWCGEFGVIDLAEAEDRARYLRDVIALFERHDVGWCLWAYNERDFSLFGRDGEPDASVIEVLSSGSR